MSILHNTLGMAVALELSAADRASIEGKKLFHRAPAKYRQSICRKTTLAPAGERLTVHLQAQQGWQLSPSKLIRDLTVLDTEIGPRHDYGRYLYFLVDEPSESQWLTAFRQWANRGETARNPGVDRYEVPGRDVLRECDRVFYRPFDKVLVVRGDYRGPALVVPES